MWTTKITNVSKGVATFDFTVEFYKKGVLYTTFTFNNVSEPSSIKRLISNQLAQYQKIDAVDDSALIGDVDLTPDPVVVQDPIVPTQAELDKQAYIEKLDKIASYERALSLGIIEKIDADYTQLVTDLKTEYKPEYISLIR